MSGILLDSFEVLRYNNLVYLRTLKCASTYYSTLLKNNGWQCQSATTINWDQDHVFSFIMNPFERRIKGLAELIEITKNYKLLDQDKNFWSMVLYLDLHSIPVTLALGNLVKKIDWIPIGHTISNDELFVKLLDHYQIKLNFDNPPVNKYQASNAKIELYNRIRDLSTPLSAETFSIVNQDNLLFENVCKSIDSSKQSWPEISWLSNNLISI